MTTTWRCLHGIHQFEAGVWVQRVQANDNLAQDQYGQASFGSLTAFLQGTISTFTVVPSPTRWAGDRWKRPGSCRMSIKLRRNLDVRVGFRFESTDGWNEAHGRASNYTFADGVIETNPTVGNSAVHREPRQIPAGAARRAWRGIRSATARR